MHGGCLRDDKTKGFHLRVSCMPKALCELVLELVIKVNLFLFMSIVLLLK